MSLKGKWIKGGETCWLHFDTKLGQQQAGDYAYQQCYAPNRSEKIEDGETYVKVHIEDVVWHYDRISFIIKTVNKDGSVVYKTQVYDPERLTLI